MVKKNSRNVVRNPRTGRMYPIKSARLTQAERDAIFELESQKFRNFTMYSHPIHVRFLFYRETQHRVDLSNLYEFAQDVLQHAGIIMDDFLIQSHDGSRKLYDPINPRTEIYITPFEQ